MENEVKEAVSMTVSIILISLVIIIAVIFSDLSYKAFNYKVKTDAINYRIQTQSQLYNYFVNPHSNISGADILDFITVYDKAYKYVLVTGTKAYWLSTEGLTELNSGTYIDNISEATKIANTKPAVDTMWTPQYITENVLGENIYSKYDGSIITGAGDVVEDVTEINSDVWIMFEMK